MKEKRRSDDNTTTDSSETSLTLTSSDHFHPYMRKKKQPNSYTPPMNMNSRRVERSLMNNQRIFASTNDDSSNSNCSLHLENFKKAIHTTYSSSSSQEETVEVKERLTESEDLSNVDINLVKVEDFEFLDSIDFSDCLDLDLFDFDNSFSINKATSLDDISMSCPPSPEVFLKPRCREPSIGWTNCEEDENLFHIITPTSPSNREISTLELLLETPLENLLNNDD